MNFVTHFNNYYLIRGWAMIKSLLKTSPKAEIYIICLDAETEIALKTINDCRLHIISYDDFEDEPIRKIKQERTLAEFCWTCTPAVSKYVAKTYKLDQITYLDADLYFYSDVEKIFDELQNDSVLITEHRFHEKVDWNIKQNGKYNVQFVTFKNNKTGMKILNWWYEKCLEWCYDRHENGLYGDQKYLDNWPEKFEGVKVLEKIKYCLAPWNIASHSVTLKDEKPYIDDQIPLIFYHFQSLKIHPENYFNLAIDYVLRDEDREIIYKPYLKAISLALTDIQKILPKFNLGIEEVPVGFLNKAKRLKRSLLGKNNLIRINN